jgi:DNA-binding NarL/FixJ family response regulator
MKVFIAEDSETVRKRIVETISTVSGVELVGEAADVSTAINDIISTKPDVAILDIRMPGGNGLDIVRKIKRQDNPPVVIILTNYPFQEYRTIAEKLNVDFFFDKSKDILMIPGLLRELAASYR